MPRYHAAVGEPGHADAQRASELASVLRSHPEGLTRAELMRVMGVSEGSIKRAIKALNHDQENVVRDPENSRYRLVNQAAGNPLLRPEPADLNAILIARAILGELADPDLMTRLDRMAEELEQRLLATQARDSSVHPRAVTASLTMGTHVDPSLLRTVLTAVRKQVLRIEFKSIWKGEQRTATVEPWQVRIHDGAIYLRAFWREVDEARTLRLAQCSSVEVCDDQPTTPAPPASLCWGDGDPAFGIDEDRPGRAEVHIRAPLSRWVEHIVWHSDQADTWDGDVLIRRVSYRSCREFARRLLSIADGLAVVEPAELREQLVGYVAEARGLEG